MEPLHHAHFPQAVPCYIRKTRPLPRGWKVDISRERQLHHLAANLNAKLSGPEWVLPLGRRQAGNDRRNSGVVSAP